MVLVWGISVVLLAGIGIAVFLLRKKQQACQTLENENILLETRNNLLKQEVEGLYTKLDNNHDTKAQFYNNINQAFKTPLTLIIEPLRSLIDNKSVPKDVSDQVNLAQRNAFKLLELVNQIIDFSSLDEGKYELRKTTFDLNDFIKSHVNVFSEFSKEKQINIELHLHDRAIMLHADLAKFEHIFYHLVSNALQFSSKETNIEITTKLTGAKGEKPVFVEFIVRDHGLGIPEKELPFIFDPYFQGKNHPKGLRSGSGLGLKLVKEYVKLHAGTIFATSEENKGSEFTITLPFDDTLMPTNTKVQVSEEFKMYYENHEAEDLGHDLLPNEIVSDNKLKVLVVEPDSSMREYIVSILTGYTIYQAADGDLALNMSKDILPDLILSEQDMPKLNGLALCKALKASKKTNHIPFVLLGERNENMDDDSKNDHGPDEYIAKPFTMNQLRSRIHFLLQMRGSLQEQNMKIVLLEDDALNIQTFEEKFIKSMVDHIMEHLEDPEFNVDILAYLMKMSRSNLFRKTKSLTGHSPSDLIRTVRLKEAVHLIENISNNHFTISEIAYKTGFKEISHFYRCFKRQYNLLPKDFIKD